MKVDGAGLAVTAGGADAVSHFEAAIQAFLEYRLDAAEHLKSALAADPAMPMALIMRGTMLMQLATRAVAGKVDQAIAAAEAVSSQMNPRERQHLAALKAWRLDRIDEARDLWAGIARAHPHNLLALRLHHFMSFWRGDRDALRTLPEAVLAAADPGLKGLGFVRAMHAFGLEETGAYEEAEAAGRAAVDENPNDLWAIHAVAHVMEMQGRARDGAEWLARPAGTWSDRNPFKDHVWWHAALFALELGEDDHALALYDRELRVDENGFYLDVQNAASFLLRLELAGVDVGDRWQALADLAEKRTGDHAMAFTDLHYMLALTGAGRIAAATRYLQSLRDFAESGAGDTAATARALTVPVAEALLDHGERRYDAAAAKLETLVERMAPVGGSHAQQDAFRLVLIDALQRGSRASAAKDRLEERLRARPADGIARRLLTRAIV